MENGNMYPRLSQLLALEKIPSELEAIKEALANIFDEIFVKNLIVGKSQNGESGSYTFDLVSDDLGIDLPLAQDLRLVFNPTNEGTTEIPIQFDYTWLIIKYIKNFNASTFDNAVESVFNILLDLAGIDAQRLLKDAIFTFYPEVDALTSFISDFNSRYNTSILANEEANLSSSEKITLLSDEIGELDFDIIKVIFESFLGISAEEGLENLKLLFANYFEDIQEKVNEIIQLHFNLSIDEISLGLQFPHKWLRPVDENTLEVLPDNYFSVLSFNAGRLLYSSKEGFDFVNTNSFNLNTSVIANTGLIISFTDLKIDLQKSTNIPEADADGRPDDFKGIYAKNTSITLPGKWFKQVDNTALSVVGNNMLIGTGGVSGTITLQATDGTPNNGNDYLDTNLGGWTVGFNYFDINFKQNVITESNIAGRLLIPRFKDSEGNVANIEITGHLNEEGDFNLTAYEEDGFKEFNLFNFVNFNILSLELGTEDDKFYIGTSCEVWFDSDIMKKILGDQKIILPKLRIYEDGSMEIVGGNAFIPTNISLNLGPVEIAVTGIHFGSIQQEFEGNMRKYNYWGFDGAISLNPLGIDARGEGVKYYYTVDNEEYNDDGDSFLRIQTIEVDLVIPGSADPSSAMAIINGMISIPEPGESQEYEGKVGLKLPKLRISGGAHMRFQPKESAFILQAEVGVPSPIPLAATGLAFYSFGGLLGYKYVAEKKAIEGFTSENTWYDYYKYPVRGVNLDKFSGPPATNDYSAPVALGAGTVLGTIFDDGFTFSTSVMAILSLPSVFILDGRANILSERLSLLDTTEPPFFAFVAIGDGSFEFAIGADYSLPSNGWILDLYAEIQAGFFSNNPSGWYLNFGTRDKPMRAEVLTIISAQTYLMLSARGIEMGARAELNIKMNFFGVKVRIEAYVEVGAKISFERLQLGGYVAFGGHISISVWRIVGFSVSLDVILGAEAVNPFLLFAELKLKICIRIIFKICVNVKVKLRWEKSKTVVIDAIPALPNTESTYIDRTEELVKGIHMLTGEVFDLEYSESIPVASSVDKIIPLDTFIDIKTMKGLDPVAVRDEIGGHTGMATNFIDLVPPEKTVKGGRVLRQVKHKYSIEKIALKMHDGSNWVDYHPFEAIVPEDERTIVENLPIGYWQRTGEQYDAIRILGTSPFSYMSSGEPGWFIPEQYGITPSELFCVSEGLKEDCATFLNKELNISYFKPKGYEAHYINGAYFSLGDENELIGFNFEVTQDLTTGETAIEDNTSQSSFQITNQINNFGYEKSLQFSNSDSLVILLPTSSREVTLKLTTFAEGVTITYFKTTIETSAINNEYQEVASVLKTKEELKVPVEYKSESDFIDKITITPLLPNITRVNEIREEIAQLFEESYDGATGTVTILQPENQDSYNELVAEYEALVSESCSIINVNDLDLILDQKTVLCEIYNEIDDDNIDEYRFRIYNDSCEIVLSSSTRYTSEVSATEEANATLYNIQNNSGSFDIKQSTHGKYYFNIINDTNEIIARRIEYFSSLSECENEIQLIKELLKNSTLEFTNESCNTFKDNGGDVTTDEPQTAEQVEEVLELIYSSDSFTGIREIDWSFTNEISSEYKKVSVEIVVNIYRESVNTLGFYPLFSLRNQDENIFFSKPIEGGSFENGIEKKILFKQEIVIPNGVSNLTFMITQGTDVPPEFIAIFESIKIYRIKEEVVSEGDSSVNYFLKEYDTYPNTSTNIYIDPFRDAIIIGDFIYAIGNIRSAGSDTGFLMQLDKEGNSLWRKTYGYQNVAENEVTGSQFTKILKLDENSIIINVIDARPSEDSYFEYDYFLLKLDLSGNIIWKKNYLKETADKKFNTDPIIDVFEDQTFAFTVNTSDNSNNPYTYVSKINSDGDIIKLKKIAGSYTIKEIKGNNILISNNYLTITGKARVLELDEDFNYVKGVEFDGVFTVRDITYSDGNITLVWIQNAKVILSKLDWDNSTDGELNLKNFSFSFSEYSNIHKVYSSQDFIYNYYTERTDELYLCCNIFSKNLDLLYTKKIKSDIQSHNNLIKKDGLGFLFMNNKELGYLNLNLDSCVTENATLDYTVDISKANSLDIVTTEQVNPSLFIPEEGFSYEEKEFDRNFPAEEICYFDVPIVIEEEETITICNTTLQEVCWLSQEKWEYNQTIPGQEAMEEEQENMVAAVESTVQPIWRPNTKYYLHFQLKDEINNGDYGDIFDYYYSFKTVGPLGHYHKHNEVTYLPENANPDNYPITSLRQYIDYNKSYPNADGSLLQAKPLFYGAEQAKIALFFAASLTQHMFKTWNAYNGLEEIKGNIHLAIKDPVTDIIIPYPLPSDFNTEALPLPEGNGEGGIPWVGDDDPRLPLNIRTLNNWIDYINENPLGSNIIKCELKIGNAIKPLSYSYSVTLTNLKPSKLYTILVYNAFDVNNNDDLISERVHEYVFQTSRYSNFEEQVNSYLLKDEEENTREAIFTIEIPLTDTDIEEAFTIVSEQNSNELSFDKLVEETLGLPPLDPPINTEFNILKNTNSDDIIAVLIRNPEPFNNPKIPIEIAKEMICIKGDTNGDYKILYSKDYANAIIMHSDKKIIVDTLDFIFQYFVWDGKQYNVDDIVEVAGISIKNN